MSKFTSYHTSVIDEAVQKKSQKDVAIELHAKNKYGERDGTRFRADMSAAGVTSRMSQDAAWKHVKDSMGSPAAAKPEVNKGLTELESLLNQGVEVITKFDALLSQLTRLGAQMESALHKSKIDDNGVAVAIQNFQRPSHIAEDVGVMRKNTLHALNALNALKSMK